MTHDQISRIAYRLWQERGCPVGSPEVDWLRAESQVEAGERGEAEERGAVEIVSISGLERVAASESESLGEVPILEAEVALRTDLGPSAVKSLSHKRSLKRRRLDSRL